MNYKTHKDLEAYQVSFKLSSSVWKIVMDWDKLAQWTIGKQLINSMDSVSANIAEGRGRYFKKDRIKFYRYSMASLRETEDWLDKALERDLVSKDQHAQLQASLDTLPKLIHQLIKDTNQKLKK